MVSGCIQSAPVPDIVKSFAPGFGSSRQRPGGTPLTFPAGIGIVGRPHRDTACMNEALETGNVYGNGTAVRFCILFSNSTQKPVTVTIPAGTVFISVGDKSQNGLVVQTIRMTVPPLSTSSFHMLSNGINEDRDDSSHPAEFEPHPVLTDYAPMLELTGLLSGKKINAEDYPSANVPPEISAAVQLAVHQVAHTGRLSADTRTSLAQLPDK